jgi:hypothetical protein
LRGREEGGESGGVNFRRGEREGRRGRDISIKEGGRSG